ncbi:MAG: class I SAM-dependent methyltransferase [Phycisphaerae bacterium]
MILPKFKDTNCDICGSWNSKELLKLKGSAYHECTTCGLIFARPIPDNLDDINEENYSAKIEAYVSKIEGKRKQYRRKLKQFSRFKKTGNFLEIGCNAGAFLKVARDIGWNVKGVDISLTASSFARENLGLDVFTGTVETAGFPSNYFDVIFTNATLEHIRNLLSTLKECHRILRPGGVFYADTVNWDSYTRQLLGSDWKYLNPIRHVHLYTPRNILSLCRYAGLKHIRTWTTGVRVKPHTPATFKTPWYCHLLKGPLSLLVRLTNKGDSIEFLARKLDLQEVNAASKSFNMQPQDYA